MHRYFAMHYFSPSPCSFHGSRLIAYGCVRVTLVQRVEHKCVLFYWEVVYLNIDYFYIVMFNMSIVSNFLSPLGMSPPSVRTGSGNFFFFWTSPFDDFSDWLHAGCPMLCAQTENGTRQIFRGTGFAWLLSLLRFELLWRRKGSTSGSNNT